MTCTMSCTNPLSSCSSLYIQLRKHTLPPFCRTTNWDSSNGPLVPCSRSCCPTAKELTFFFFLFRATPAAYGGSHARGQIAATTAGLHQSHTHARSELHPWPTPQLMATPVRPLSEATGTCNLVVPSRIGLPLHCNRNSPDFFLPDLLSHKPGTFPWVLLAPVTPQLSKLHGTRNPISHCLWKLWERGG